MIPAPKPALRPVYSIRLGARAIAIADLFEHDLEGVWELSRINVPPRFRGQGYGTRLLTMVLDAADEAGVTLVLWPSATRSRNEHGRLVGLHQQALIAWYERHGFVREGDRGLPHRLRREPRS